MRSVAAVLGRPPDHDTQCVDYEGPDADYAGREICVSSAAQWGGFSREKITNTVAVVDVTDKSSPQVLSNIEYPRDGYSQQGWLTPDQATFLHGDELDEVFNGTNTRTRVWDVSDLDNPALKAAFDNSTTSIDHNMTRRGSTRTSRTTRPASACWTRATRRRGADGDAVRRHVAGERQRFVRGRHLEQLPVLPAKGRRRGQHDGPRAVPAEAAPGRRRLSHPTAGSATDE